MKNKVAAYLFSRLPHAIIAGLTAALYLSGDLTLIDNKLTDLGFEWSARPATGNVVLVEIDARSIEQFEIWPWPRRYHAAVIDRLLEAGARRVAFDVDFSARSRPEDDRLLARAINRAEGKVILPAFRQFIRLENGEKELKLSLPLPMFSEHSTIASINVQPEPDGLVRTMAVRDGPLASMASILEGQESFRERVFHIDYGIQLSTIPRLSYIDVLHGTFSPDEVAGKKIVIGSTAIELGDQVAVPIYKSIPGPFTHILGYEALVQGRALYEVAAAPIVLGILLVSFFIAPLFLEWRWQRSLLVLLLVLGGLVALSVAVQILLPVLLDVAPMLIAAIFCFIYAVIKRVDQQALRLVFQGLDLRRKDVMMRNVVENSFDGIITMDTEGVIEAANPAATKIFDDALIGRNVQELFPDLTGCDHSDALVDALRIGMDTHEMPGWIEGGQPIPIEMSVSFVDTEDQLVYTMFFRDISARKEQQKKLEYQAQHDALTRLPNRKLFADRLQQTIEKCEASKSHFAVLLLDLDRFKEVNDTLGHPTGDLLLKQISERLQANIPASDTIARIGGDEFALLLPSANDVATASRASEDILSALSDPFDLSGLSLEIGGSIGIAMYPQHGDDGPTLVKCADVAMYLAKEGQNRFALYDEEKDHNSVRFLTLTGDLRRAIEDNQLILHYQPKISLKENRIIAVEALIRWIHPTHGFIPPDDFIDKAEQTGVIGDMTDWVVDTALAQSAEWRRKGFQIDMAVNISARLLNDFEIVKTVNTGLRKWRVPPESLILEVTENALMDDPAKAMEVITSLSKLQTRISIDDFGTGYSSLGYLKDLPADEMKIDRCFVQSMLEDESNETIVRSTIGLAHGLGLKVVAEGIETEADRAHLADIQCDVGQGYLFSKPLPIEEFDEWLASSPWGIQPVTFHDADKLALQTV